MKVFYPQKTLYVDAITPPHPPETRYKVSIGTEFWDTTPVSVIKIQMEYDGKVEGRKSPSYPLGTKDFENVSKAVQQLMNGEC